jgi:hypothetical protein
MTRLLRNRPDLTREKLGRTVIIAQQHWPDLVACERKKDLGADALTFRRPSRGSDGADDYRNSSTGT